MLKQQIVFNICENLTYIPVTYFMPTNPQGHYSKKVFTIAFEERMHLCVHLFQQE